MGNLLRRLRGAIGIGITWAVLWSVAGLLLYGVFSVVQPDDIGEDDLAVVMPIFATVGFLSGLGFALMLAFVERHRTVRDLVLPRVALWGFLGSALIPLLMGAGSEQGLITGTLGAIFAAGTVALARRARDAAPVPSP